ncbi:sulfite exporter TauE/SafE family protein [Candidatus Woesearchaeota archaeon]|nr:sulfite exporter TauE/SafE family protein [Candidatus Woesearchaeota archaeon]
MVEPTIIVAFIAGIVSFASPCVLPLIPGFLAYLSGTSAGQQGARLKIFMNSVAFVLGFSVIFALLGVLLNTILERVSYNVQTWLSRIGGIIIILFALYILGLIKINFLEREHKFAVKKKFSITYVTSFVFGAAFAVGWTPCVSAILGSVFALAVTNPSLGFVLLMSYALGLGIPFLLVGLFTTQAIGIINKSATVLKYFNIIVGILLLVLGILVFTNKLNVVANWFFAYSLLS